MISLRTSALNLVHRWRVDVTRAIEHDLAALAPQITGRLLDLGCGAKPYRQILTGVSAYLGVDLPVGRSANKFAKRADVYADLAHLPFPSESFDAILCTQVLEHVPDPAKVLAEAQRVLRASGTVVLTLPFAASEHEEPHDYLRFTSYGIRALLERHGFEAVQVKKQFGFWSAIGEMIFWHFHRKVQETWLEKYWFSFGAVAGLRFFHFLNWIDRDDKLALNLCVMARRSARTLPTEAGAEELEGVAAGSLR